MTGYADSITAEAEKKLIDALFEQGDDIPYGKNEIERDTLLYTGGMGLNLSTVIGAVADIQIHNDTDDIPTHQLISFATVGELADHLSQYL